MKGADAQHQRQRIVPPPPPPEHGEKLQVDRQKSPRASLDVSLRVYRLNSACFVALHRPVLLTHLSLWRRWRSTSCPGGPGRGPAPLLPGPAPRGKIPTFLSMRQALLPGATRSPPSDPHARVPGFTICPHLTSPHTHTPNVYGHTHTHWHERPILTSSCSTSDRQTGSNMRSERGLWGQGAGRQPRCEGPAGRHTGPFEKRREKKRRVGTHM